jgi:hypothetical protein
MDSPADNFPDAFDGRIVSVETAAQCMALPTALLIQAFAMEDYYPAADTMIPFGDARRVVRACGIPRPVFAERDFS